MSCVKVNINLSDPASLVKNVLEKLGEHELHPLSPNSDQAQLLQLSRNYHFGSAGADYLLECCALTTAQEAYVKWVEDISYSFLCETEKPLDHHSARSIIGHNVVAFLKGDLDTQLKRLRAKILRDVQPPGKCGAKRKKISPSTTEAQPATPAQPRNKQKP